MIFSGPNKPAKGFSVCETISFSIFATAKPLIFEILFTCTFAAATEISGSNPLPLAVTKSVGISSLLTSGSVSYTHLDVYKRQEYRIALEIRLVSTQEDLSWSAISMGKFAGTVINNFICLSSAAALFALTE